jgi:tetratricopeptide (TPR) repeat protein
MWRQVVAQSPDENAPAGEILRYDVGWKALNTMLNSGRSLSGHERNCCFLNTRGGRFADVSASANIDFDDDGRVLAVVDWDLDGDQDFWIANRTGPQVRFLRNDADNDHGYISFRLAGVTCNRDAIGARVELMLPGETSPRFQTVRAGEGYLAQCSRWVHFGLGDVTEIPQVTVRWPDGKVDTFHNVTPNRRYTLEQSGDRLEPWQPPRIEHRLQPSKIEVPPSTEQSRIVLIAPVPIPEIRYESAAGASEPIVSANLGRPRLVNLWATWCQPCVVELAEWTGHADKLAASGLEVLAINVDEPEADRPQQKQTIGEFAAELGLPFTVGFGTQDLVVQFDVLQRSVQQRQRPLPVPSSFLIDAGGNLRIIYRGPVSPEQLVADAKLIEATPEEIVAASVPYSGKWLGHPVGTSPNTIAIKFVEGGFHEQTIRYIERLNQTQFENPSYKKAEANVLLGAVYADQGKWKESSAAFRAALALDPHHRQSHIELAGVLVQLKEFEEAAEHYREALAARGNDPELRMKLGLALTEGGHVEQAVQELNESVSLRPSALAQHHLGNAFVRLGKTGDAIDAFAAACELDDEFAPARNNLAWLLATTPDDSLRDGQRAVSIAAALCAHANNRTAGNLDTLAAAYAEANRFPDAIATLNEAIRLAKAAGDLERSMRMERRLELYKKNEPYRDAR